MENGRVGAAGSASIETEHASGMVGEMTKSFRLLRLAASLGLSLALAACDGSTPDSVIGGASSSPLSGRVDVGGSELAYTCTGEGSPTIVLEAGLGAAGTSEWSELIPQLDVLSTRVCTYDRAGTGTSDDRPDAGPAPTAATQAGELHSLLEGAGIDPPYVLVPHSYGGLVARVFADRYPDQVAGFVFEDVSTAWEIDLWPRWDDSPWIDGGQKIDIQTTERQVLDAEPMGSRPSIVVSQSTYAKDGIPRWAAPIFARQQGKLAGLGDDVIHIRVEDTGHFIHRERPAVVIAAISAVVDAVRSGDPLPTCADVFDEPVVTCLS
jgi:pimeloyl-ACP methyl ester carboxylesterase